MARKLKLASIITLLLLAATSVGAMEMDVRAMHAVHAGMASLDVRTIGARFEKTARLIRTDVHPEVVDYEVTVAAGQDVIRLWLPSPAAMGQTWKYTLTDNVSRTVEKTIRTIAGAGDVNITGEIDSGDVVAMQQELAQPGSAEVFANERADVNGDGIFNNSDVTYLQDHLSGVGPAPIRLLSGSDLWNPSSPTPNSIDALILGMANQDGVSVAGYCYTALFEIGTEEVVTKLIQSASTANPGTLHKGITIYTKAASNHTLNIRLAEAYLLLIEAIQQGTVAAPFSRPQYIDSTTKSSITDAQLALVIASYSSWDATWQGTAVHARPPALTGLPGITLPVLRYYAYSFLFRNGEDFEVPGSETTYDIDTCATQLKYGTGSLPKYIEYYYGPPGLAGERPYNCAGWAMGCQKRWIWPFDGSPGGYEDMLAEFGFSGPPSTSGEGLSDGDICACFVNGNLEHFYKNTGPNTWAGKMGEGPLVYNITDPEKHFNNQGVDESLYADDLPTITFKYYSMD